MSFRDYSTTPSSNTALGDGTYIGPSMLRNKVRPALQQLAADGRALSDEIDGTVDDAAAAAQAAIDAAVFTVTSAPGQTVSTRNLLAAIEAPENGQTAVLSEVGIEGTFKFSTSNLSAKVASDPGRGVYVAPAAAPTGAIGAWVRIDTSVKGSDTSYSGNADNADHALTLTKIGVVVAPDAAKAYMANIAEGPMVFWDDADGYYHMVFAAYSAVPAASVGHAKSLDLLTWTTDAAAMFGVSGTPGAPDQNGTSGPYIVKKSGTYYLFYIGLTATGYEGGEKSICLATATSLTGPWTRLGAVISKGAAGGVTDWRSAAVWHPSIVQRGGAYYMFFNATGSDAKERIGWATSNDLLTWTVQDATSPLINVGGGGSWKSSIVGDPSVYRDGDYWFMNFFGYNGTAAGDGIAWTSDTNFPLGWTEHPANPILAPGASGSFDATYAHKPFAYFKGGTKYHFYTAVGGGVRSIALAIGARPSVFKNLTVSDFASGSQEMLKLYGNWQNGDEKGVVFRNQDDQIIGQIKLKFDGTQTYYTFGHFYNGGFSALDRVFIGTNGLDTTGVYKVAGLQVVGARGAAIADAAAAAAAPTQAEFNALVTKFNLLLACLRAATGHGLIA